MTNRRLIPLVSTALLVVVGMLAPAPLHAQGPPSAVEYYHLDALGSVRVVTNQAGVVVSRHDLMPFGEEWQPVTLGREALLFTGKERDFETGLDYFGARYLKAALGRFTTVDPAGGRLAAPQTLNRYAYVSNNPLRFVDPTGMYEVDAACSKDRRCSTEAARFERELRRALTSSDSGVAAAAAAYGSLGDGNGVTVNFASRRAVQRACGSGGAACVSPGFVGDAETGAMSPAIAVLFQTGMNGTDFERAIVHEGSHVSDDLGFIRSWDRGTMSFDAGKNFTVFTTESRAYELETRVDVTAPHPLRGAVRVETENRISSFLRDPRGVYAARLNNLVFNPAFTRPR